MGSSANHQPMPPTDEALVGTILDHQYQLTAVLGKGGQACVYKAMSVHLQEPVAVKVWHREFASDPGKLEKFREEARIAARLEHRNIARIRAMGVDGIHAYLVMEYMAGTSLEMALQKDGPMQPADFLNVFRQVCNGLRFAHEQQILHRDLKPSNIMLVQESNTSSAVAKLVDFGMARVLDAGVAMQMTLTRNGHVTATPAYMSPEQCKQLPLDVRSDIYSLGCTMFEALVGHPPFVAETYFNVMSMHVDTTAQFPDHIIPLPGIQHVVLKCLAKEPNDRYNTVDEVLDALNTIALEDEQPNATSDKTKIVLLILLFGLTLLVAGGLKIYMLPQLKASPPEVPSGKSKRDSTSQRRVSTVVNFEEQVLAAGKLEDLEPRKALALYRKLITQIKTSEGPGRLLNLYTKCSVIESKPGLLDDARNDLRHAKAITGIETLDPIIAAIPIARTEATYLNQIRDYNGAVLQLKKALKSLDSSALTQTDPAMVAHTRASLLQGLAEMRNNQGNLTGAIQASRASLAIPTGTLDERGYKCGWLAEIADRAANTKTFDYAMKLHRQLCGKSSNGSCGPNTADCFYYAAEQLFLRKKLRRSLQLAEVANAEYSHLASPQPKHVYCLTLLAALQIHYKNYEAANAYLKQTQSLNSKASADLIQEQQALWKILKKVKRL